MYHTITTHTPRQRRPRPHPQNVRSKRRDVAAQLLLDSGEKKLGRQAGGATEQGARATGYRGKASGEGWHAVFCGRWFSTACLAFYKINVFRNEERAEVECSVFGERSTSFFQPRHFWQ